jgi:hypothetical protein
MLPSTPPYPATEGLSVRVAFILTTVMTYVGARVFRKPFAPFGMIIPVRIENLINGWLLKRRTAILALMRRIEAGIQRPPRPYKPRAPKPETAEPKPAGRGAGLRLPTRLNWIGPLGGEITSALGGLLGVLDEAAMKAMVLAHPRLAALIRPLLRMGGQRPPAWFPTSPRRARSTATGAKRRPWARPRSDYPGQQARAAEDEAAASDTPPPDTPPPATPTEELARFADRALAIQQAQAREALYPGWLWIGGRPTIPPPREENSPPPPPPPPRPAPARWAVAHDRFGRVIPSSDPWAR